MTYVFVVFQKSVPDYVVLSMMRSGMNASAIPTSPDAGGTSQFPWRSCSDTDSSVADSPGSAHNMLM